MFTMLMIMFGVFNIFYFVGQFGELATAGYGTAVRIEQVLLLPVIGLNTAVLSIAGQNFGAKMYFRVKEVYGKALMFGSGFMVLAGIFVYLTSEIIISFFTNDLEVIRRGALYLLTGSSFNWARVSRLLYYLCFISGTEKTNF